MKCKKACLIINPRSGKNVAKLADIMAVFSAAGWKTDIALKEFGGHTMQLAREAAEAGYDLVIGYGGDGTLNQVVNGVMAAERRGSIVGVIPGGTANVWAHELGIPEDPVKASLLLVNSEKRKVDLGHVQVDSLSGKRGGRHHFLLMAGLGFDAAILRHVSTSLKEKIGAAAVALTAVKELPSQHTFPIEIRSLVAGKKRVLWRGEALQVIVGNTRRYGNIAEVTPEALIDDGVLDVCVITAGDPLTTIEQILSILFHRKPENGRSEHFQGAHFWIRVPASVYLQLDGSRVKAKDLDAAPAKAAKVTYRFDALPRALRVAIPRTYTGPLFEEGTGREKAHAPEQQRPDQDAVRAGAERIDALLENGREVTVVGAAPNPQRKGTFIVAGKTSKKKTKDSKPVAVRVDPDTILFTQTGETLPAASAAELPEGTVMAVKGKQSKRGVIRAKSVIVKS